MAIGDVTGDGWPDIYLARLEGPNALYVNEGTGDFSFRKVPSAGGAALRGEYSTGVVLADVTGTGPLDLLVTTLGGPNAVFVNEGAGEFRRVEGAGLRSGQGATTMALADLNGDEALDLYVANYKEQTIKDLLAPSERRFEDVVVQTEAGNYRIREGFRKHYDVRRQGNRLMRFEIGEPDRVYFNREGGRFVEREWGEVFRAPDGSRPSEVPRDWGLVARLEDLNGDGEADLYVCNDFESPDFYYLGREGAGHLEEAPAEALRTTSHSTMSIATTDVKRDGGRDFFLADMLGRSYERRHQQVGVGRPIPREVGDETVRMQEMQNTFQLNRGDGTHAEIGRLAGVEASGWTWASAFLDVNLDGYSDLIATNGHAYDAMHADTQMQLRSRKAGAGVRGQDLLKYPDLDLPNVAFRNEGDGTFTEVEEGWGLGREADVGHGMARADLDRDGDRDVVINRLNRPAGIYRNEATGKRLAVQLSGRAPNTRGIGASVTVEPAGESVPPQEKAVIEGGEYLSDSGEVLTFAMGEAREATIRVEWPTGEETEVEGRAGRLYDLRQPGAEVEWGADSTSTVVEASEDRDSGNGDRSRVNDGTLETDSTGQGVDSGASASDSSSEKWFEEISDELSHTHSETKYQDFQRQPLLSHRLSQAGPGAAWVDMDRDGDEDLVIGTGRGGSLQYFRNEGGGAFARVQGGDASRSYNRDLTGIVAHPTSTGAKVFVGRSNYERQPDDPKAPSIILVFEADGTGLTLVNRLSFGDAALGPLALSDVDGDGDLDLFAGGRHVPGQYPLSASSKLFLNQDGSYEPASALSRPFQKIGLVSSATFADLEGNGQPDLLLASEWGPIKYFRNEGDGRFVDRTSEVGLSEYSGLWRGIGIGDFNEDGKTDLVATNWGWNSRYGHPPGAPSSVESPLLAHPLRVYYSDFSRNGVTDVVETHYHSGREEYVPFVGFSRMGQAMRYLRRRVRTFERYSKLPLSEIIGEQRFSTARTKEAATVSHMVFMNAGTGEEVQFRGRALHWWSQLTAGFSPSVADVTGDGHQDIVLSQNFFATQVKIPRQDGGRGLVLRGDGSGKFTPIKGQQSGLLAYGEQRAAPLADVDDDGRIDILVTQNGATTKFYRNVKATPGVEVRLVGPDSNRRAIGASVRLRYTDGTLGPATLISAGTAYWTQHDLTPVIGHGAREVAGVQVTWPDGNTTERDVDPDAETVTVERSVQ